MFPLARPGSGSVQRSVRRSARFRSSRRSKNTTATAMMAATTAFENQPATDSMRSLAAQ